MGASVRPLGRRSSRDLAANHLDGEFYGAFPSFNHINGGDSIAELQAYHNKVFCASDHHWNGQRGQWRRGRSTRSNPHPGRLAGVDQPVTVFQQWSRPS